MELHRNGFLQTYIDNLNQILEKYPEYQSFSLEQLICYAENMPAQVCDCVLHNAGGAYNHIFYFSNLRKNNDTPLAGSLADQIEWQFGCFRNFRDLFTTAALSVFGSGYAWLVLDEDGKLAFRTTDNQGTLLLTGERPILSIDVWNMPIICSITTCAKIILTTGFPSSTGSRPSKPLAVSHKQSVTPPQATG